MPKNPDEKVANLDAEVMPEKGKIQYPIIHGHRLAVEVWAHQKGMLPEIIPAPPAPKGHIPEAPRHNPKYSEFAAAKAGSRWPIGAELTEAEFDAAVDKFYGPQNVMR